MILRAILFDVFGTLLDVYSVQARAEALFPGHGPRLAALWRERQIEYTRLRTLSDRYVDFSQVTRDALEFACAALGLAADEVAVATLMNEYDRLAAAPEASAVLAELQRRGVRTGVLSNGDPALLERSLRHAGLWHGLDPVLSADQVRAFKTAAPVYQLGPDALGMPAREILFVSSNGWDACGAAWFGYTSCWINRTGAPLERLGVEPSFTGTDLHTVLAALAS